MITLKAIALGPVLTVIAVASTAQAGPRCLPSSESYEQCRRLGEMEQELSNLKYEVEQQRKRAIQIGNCIIEAPVRLDPEKKLGPGFAVGAIRHCYLTN